MLIYLFPRLNFLTYIVACAVKCVGSQQLSHADFLFEFDNNGFSILSTLFRNWVVLGLLRERRCIKPLCNCLVSIVNWYRTVYL